MAKETMKDKLDMMDAKIEHIEDINADNRALIVKLVKQRKDSAQIYNEQNRQDLEKDELEQLKHLEVYLPKQLSEDEIKIIIDTIVDDLGAVSMKDMGRVMSEANKKIGSQADGKLIANIVRNKLQ